MLRTLLLLCDAGRTGRVVAMDGDATLTAETLWRQAAIIAALLPPPVPSSMVAFAFGKDRGAFAAALLGTWLAGHGAALPENARRELVMPVMRQPEVVAFLHDTGVGRGTFVPKVLAETPLPPLPKLSSLLTHEHEAQRIVLATHTVCMSGAVRQQRWTSAQLLAAVDALAARMGLPAGGCIASSLSPSFLPAVLAGLLVPLRIGAAFCLAAPRSLDQLVATMLRTKPDAVLCSPMQRRGLARHPVASQLASQRIFCSASDVFGDAVLGDTVERDLPEFDAAVERLLAVNGVEDAAIVPAPHAALLVAIAGRESALARVEREIVRLLPRDSRPEVRQFARLPRDDNDRLVPSEVFFGFDRGRDALPTTRELAWQAMLPATASAARFRALIPTNYAFFEGHFVTYPVLAGAVQLDRLVVPCARAAWPDLGALQQLDSVKFLTRIVPGETIDVTLQRVGDGDRFAFEIWRGDDRCTSGKMTFAATAAGGA